MRGEFHIPNDRFLNNPFPLTHSKMIQEVDFSFYAMKRISWNIRLRQVSLRHL